MSSWNECPEPYLLSKAHAERDPSSVAGHLEGCKSCSAFWQDMDDMREIARQIPAPTPSPQRIRQVRHALLAQAGKATGRVRTRTVAWALGAAALTALIGRGMMTGGLHHAATERSGSGMAGLAAGGAGEVAEPTAGAARPATDPTPEAARGAAGLVARGGGGKAEPSAKTDGAIEHGSQLTIAAEAADHVLGIGAAAHSNVARGTTLQAPPSRNAVLAETTVSEAPKAAAPGNPAPALRADAEERRAESVTGPARTVAPPSAEQSTAHSPGGVGQQVAALTAQSTTAPRAQSATEPRAQSKSVVTPRTEQEAPKQGRAEEQRADQRAERQEHLRERREERAERQRERRLEQQERREERRGK